MGGAGGVGMTGPRPIMVAGSSPEKELAGPTGSAFGAAGVAAGSEVVEGRTDRDGEGEGALAGTVPRPEMWDRFGPKNGPLGGGLKGGQTGGRPPSGLDWEWMGMGQTRQRG